MNRKNKTCNCAPPCRPPAAACPPEQVYSPYATGSNGTYYPPMPAYPQYPQYPAYQQPSSSEPICHPCPPCVAEDGTALTSELTMRDLLRESIGSYIVTEHLMGVSDIVSKAGTLIRVESNCFVLRNMQANIAIDTVCEYYSLKFFRRLPSNVHPIFSYPGYGTGCINC